MYFLAAKILPLVVMPLSISLFLLLAGLLMVRKPRLARVLLLGSFSVLWLSSTPLVAEAVLGSLESQYPPTPLSKVSAAKCAVLLGGAVSPRLPPRTDIEIGQTSDRVVKAAQLFKARKAQKIIISAGNKPHTAYDDSNQPEAELLKELLVAWGTPESAIVQETESRNTRENALNSAPLLEELECGPPLLITSAAHMPRAVGAFAIAGTDVIPVSVDIRVTDSSRSAWETVIPGAEALEVTSGGLREWLGKVIYQLKEWN